MKKPLVLVIAIGLLVGILSTASSGAPYPAVYNLPQYLVEQLEAIGVNLPYWDPGPMPVGRAGDTRATKWAR